ncbi:MAG: histone deacetylase, partial [bacterium]|nr:histone deacetylase [bacterium]
MPTALSPHRIQVALPEGHRFPMAKYARLAERLSAEGWSVDDAPDVLDADLERAHDIDYLAAIAACDLDERAVRRLGFPLSPALVRRSRASVGGTL